jgi:hypothetical protein
VAGESTAGFFGRSVRRLEDGALLRGAGRVVADIVVPGALSPLGIVISDLPVTPARLCALIVAADERA